jgi:hypothetical protein
MEAAAHAEGWGHLEIGPRFEFLQGCAGTLLYFGAYRVPSARGARFFSQGLHLPVQASLQTR